MRGRYDRGLILGICLLFLFLSIQFLEVGVGWSQASYLPPYVRLSLSYFDGDEYKLSEDVSEGSLYGRSKSLSNFGVRVGYGVFLDHQTRLQVEGSILLVPLAEYEWRDPPGLGLTSKLLSFEESGSQTLIQGVLSSYYDFDRLNPYSPGSWTPYVGGGLGVYTLWWPRFSVEIANDSQNASLEGYVNATVLDSGKKPTGESRGLVVSEKKLELLLGPVGMLELGASYNFSYVIVEGYGRIEYLYSLAEGRDSVLIGTLNVGMRF